MANLESGPIVTNCTFRGNSAVLCGGGMGNYLSFPSFSVTNCDFSFNDAGYGGGMLNEISSPAVTNCTFFGKISIKDL